MELAVITLYYCLAALVVLLGLSALVLRLRWHRARMPGDGLFVLHEWGPLRGVVAFNLIVFLVVPLLALSATYVLGAILAACEGWAYFDGYEYVLGNMLGIGPIATLIPSQGIGMVVDIIVSIWAFLLASSILGLGCGLSLMLEFTEKIPPTLCGLLLILFLGIPAILLLTAAATGALMAWLEEWTSWDGFLFMVGTLCGLSDPLTAVGPSTDTGFFLLILCFMLELSFGGTIIGLAGSHPKMFSLLVLFEGTPKVEGQGTAEEAEAGGGRA